jgi:glycosyltransferase involved in cell wall biosynthesis
MSLRILAMTNLFPNPYQPNKWGPNCRQLQILAKRTPVRVIVPLPWTTEVLGKRRHGDLLGRSRQAHLGELQADYGRYWFPPGIFRRRYGAWYHWSVRPLFQRVVREWKPDLIFTHWAYPDGWAAVKLGHAAGLPVILQVLGSDVLRLNRHPSRVPGTLAALREADGIWAVSQDLRSRVIQLGVSPSQVRVIYDGVDPEYFHPGDQQQARRRLGLTLDEKMILFVGNLELVKGLERLLAACRILAVQLPGLRCFLVGQGSLRRKLENEISRQGLTKCVTLVGSLPLSELGDWYRAADVLALPSDSEGVPNVLLEAAACGVPYVASCVGGIPEIAQRGQGFLVPAGDLQALTSGLLQVLQSPRSNPLPAKTRAQCMDESLQFFQSVHACYHKSGQSIDIPMSHYKQSGADACQR